MVVVCAIGKPSPTSVDLMSSRQAAVTGSAGLHSPATLSGVFSVLALALECLGL